LPLLDCRVHPEGLGIVMDKKLLNTVFWEDEDKAEFSKI